MKKAISLILSTLMLLSVFSVLPLTASAAEITTITVNQLLAPAAGNYPDKTAQVAESNCSVDSIYWYNYTDKAWMTDNETFVKGKVYEANVHVKANDGSKFADESTIIATINNKAVSISHVTMEEPEEYLNLSCKFTASSENKKVTSVKISGVTEPVAGQKADYSYNEGATAYTIKNLLWYSVSESKYLGSKDTFKANSEYKVKAYIYPNDDFQFSDSLTATINDNVANVNGVVNSSIYEYACVSYVFKTGDLPVQVVSQVDLTGIPEPEIGKGASFTYNSNDVFTAELYHWRNNTTVMSLGDKFTAGNEYSVWITLSAKDGYSFEVDENGNPAVSATINGKKAQVLALWDGGSDKKIFVNYFFPKLTEEESTTEAVETTAPAEEKSITDIGIVSVAEPEVGAAAKRRAYTRGPANYSVYSVSWYNKTDGYLMMIGDDTFEAGKTYTARVTVDADAGYTFNNPTATINRKTAKVGTVSGYNEKFRLLITYDFTTPNEKSDPEMIKDVNITGVDEPKAGQVPSAKAVGEDNYFIESVTWYNDTDRVGIDAPETFEEGKEYNVIIALRPHAGYRFNYNPNNVNELDVNTTVNGVSGNSYHVSSYSEGTYIHVNCKFTATAGETPETTAVTEATTAAPEATTKPTEAQQTTAAPEATTKPTEAQQTTAAPEAMTKPTEALETTAPEQPTTVAPETKSDDTKLNSNPKAKTSKKANTLSVKAKAKTVKIKKLKKKSQNIKPLTVKKNKGKITYKLIKKGTDKKIWKYLKISKKGVITLKRWKKAKKGTYKIKITVTAAGNKSYKKGSKTVTAKIKIK